MDHRLPGRDPTERASLASRLAGSRLAGSRLAGSRLAGSRLAGHGLVALALASLLLALGSASCRAPREASARGPTPENAAAGSGAVGRSPAPADRHQARPITAQEVLLIGDSYVEIPDRELNAELSRLARAARLIGPDESFRDQAISGTQLVGGHRPIPWQYANAERESPARLLILDGGGNDIVAADCADCAALKAAVQGATNLFQTLAADRSVERIIYFFYPDLPNFPAFRADAADFLRPRLAGLCTASLIPCTFVDLRPVFRGHPEFIGPDHLHPTAAGAQAMARVIFERLQAAAASL